MGKTESEIGVASVELGDRRVVARFQTGDVVAPRSEIDEEGPSGDMAKANS